MLPRESLPYDVNPRDLRTESPFKDLFPINKTTLEALTESMRKHGYDQSFPMIVWHGVVVDGHTRLLAAKRAGIREVRCHYREFQTDDEALELAIRSQRDRRNITDVDIMRCVEALDRRNTKAEAGSMRGDPGELVPHGTSSSEPEGRTAKKTAELLGVNYRKVERARTVIDHGTEKQKKAVLSGEKTINAAASEIHEARKKDRDPLPTPAPAPEPNQQEDTDMPKKEQKFDFTINLTIQAKDQEEATQRFEAVVKQVRAGYIVALLCGVK